MLFTLSESGTVPFLVPLGKNTQGVRGLEGPKLARGQPLLKIVSILQNPALLKRCVSQKAPDGQICSRNVWQRATYSIEINLW